MDLDDTASSWALEIGAILRSIALSVYRYKSINMESRTIRDTQVFKSINLSELSEHTVRACYCIRYPYCHLDNSSIDCLWPKDTDCNITSAVKTSQKMTSHCIWTQLAQLEKSHSMAVNLHCALLMYNIWYSSNEMKQFFNIINYIVVVLLQI